jgi:pimeloyl-ACP methyl ester carboxylesterase
MPILDRDGARIYYEVHGSGPAILLTHGYSATSQMWRGQVAEFTKRNTLIIWDMRGHGQSHAPADPAAYSAEKTVADMSALLDVAGAQTAIVGGLSLGGFMSLAFHRAHAGRVSALMMISTGPGFRKDEPREAWNKRAAQIAVEWETEGLARQQRLSQEAATANHRSAQGLALAARGMLTQADGQVIESLTGIKVPSLVVVGANDTPFLAASDYMAAKIPAARKVVIPNAGHSVNLDQPEIFNREVGAFLADLA